MYFEIKRQLPVSDDSLVELLYEVYVDEGYTDSDLASEIFLPDRVRDRGQLLVAQQKASGNLLGLLIVVPFESHYSFLSEEGECELHLLGVRKPFRGHGVAKALVQQALKLAAELGCNKVNLCTQSTMKAAQHLYKVMGFEQRVDRNYAQNGRLFWVYERPVNK